MGRLVFLLSCSVWLGCGETASDAKYTPLLGVREAGESCAKPEDCVRGLGCGDDFLCYDPNPSASSGLSGLFQSGAGPSGVFAELQRFAARYGSERAVDALGTKVIRNGMAACAQQACIQDRFRGNRGAWITQKTATRADPCASYQPAGCTTTEVRRALSRVMSRLHTCRVLGQVKHHSAVRLRVECDGVNDFVTLEPTGNGTGWRISSEANGTFPGLLPNVYRASVARER